VTSILGERITSLVRPESRKKRMIVGSEINGSWVSPDEEGDAHISQSLAICR
jgi:hypothetical protein